MKGNPMSAKNVIDVSAVSKRLVKVRVRVSAFFGKVSNDEGQSELANSHDAEKDALGVTCALFPKNIQKEIRDHAVGIRTALKKNTLPFQDGGFRIMKAVNYGRLNADIQARREAFRAFIYDEVYMKYPELKEHAKNRLGSLYNEDDFPDREKLMDKFDAVIMVDQVTDPNNLLIEGLTDVELETIKTNTLNEYKENLKSAQMEIVANLKAAIKSIIEKTGNEKSRYKRALKNLGEACEMVPNLNILEDAELNELAEKIKVAIADKDSDLVKEDDKVRNKLVEDAKTLVDALDGVEF